MWSCKQAAQHVMTPPYMIVLNLKLKTSRTGCRTSHLVACTPMEHVPSIICTHNTSDFTHILPQVWAKSLLPKFIESKGSITERLMLAWCVYNGKGSNSLPLNMHIAKLNTCLFVPLGFCKQPGCGKRNSLKFRINVTNDALLWRSFPN